MVGLNFSNMMEDVIGKGGLSRRTIENIKDQVEAAHIQIRDRLWPELAFIDLTLEDTSEIKKIAADIKKESENFLILGVGGSARGPRAILDALSPFHNFRKRPKVFIYDNVDPTTLKHILSVIDLKTTSVNVISKSGSTVETAASFMILWDEMKKIHGYDASKRFFATTDPERGGLRKIANEEDLRSLTIPQGVVGRYSVLSPVGLLLSEVIEINSEELLKGARDIYKRCSDADLWKNPAYLFGTLLYLMDKEKHRNINVMVAYADSLKALCEWFCQLWAESLGKNGKGPTPYPSIGAVDQHSQLQLWVEGPEDKVLIFISINDYGTNIKIPDVFKGVDDFNYLSGHTLSELIKAEEEATELALTKAGRPSMTITVEKIDAYHMGQLFHLFEIATAFTGFLYGVNPFNQPGVEESKNLVYGIMGRKGFEEKKKEIEKHRATRNRWKI